MGLDEVEDFHRLEVEGEDQHVVEEDKEEKNIKKIK